MTNVFRVGIVLIHLTYVYKFIILHTLYESNYFTYALQSLLFHKRLTKCIIKHTPYGVYCFTYALRS